VAGLTLNPGEQDVSRIVQVVRQLCEGKNNAVVEATLTANATSTTVTAPTCSPTSAILPSAVTAHAANDIPLMNFTPDYGQFVITHANNARVDRTFNFVVLG